MRDLPPLKPRKTPPSFRASPYSRTREGLQPSSSLTRIAAQRISLSLSSPDPTRKGERHRGPSIVFKSPPSCCSSTCPLVRRLRRCIERDATGQSSQRPLLIIVAVAAVVVCDHRFPSSSSSRTPFRAETSVPVQQHIVVKVGPSGKTSRDSSRPPRRRSDIAHSRRTHPHAQPPPPRARQAVVPCSSFVVVVVCIAIGAFSRRPPTGTSRSPSSTPPSSCPRLALPWIVHLVPAGAARLDSPTVEQRATGTQPIVSDFIGSQTTGSLVPARASTASYAHVHLPFYGELARRIQVAFVRSKTRQSID